MTPDHEEPDTPGGPVVPVGGGVPVDPVTGRRYGFLPRKAAERKHIIRAELGLPWIFAAVTFAVVVLLAGLFLLLTRSDHPAGFDDEGSLTRYAQGEVSVLQSGTGWLDRRSGLTALAGDVGFCPADGGWVGAADERYDERGRGVGTAPGLELWPVRASGGRVYVDPHHPFRAGSGAAPLAPCTTPRELGEPPEPDGL